MTGVTTEIASAAADDAALEKVTLQKVTRRLIPFLFVLYVVNMLDRTNVGIARLRMLVDLGMDETTYATGVGLFYVGYFVFEIPSNLILARTGARVWIARILMSWGLVSAAMMFVTSAWSFYLLRVLLGFTEAGFFPGIILYLSYWFPLRARARAITKFMAASTITAILGNPLSGAIMQYMDKIGGLAGWQWVFVIEGLPAVALGFVALRYLTDRPEKADWLAPAERDWLVQKMESERRALGHDHQHTLRAALTNPLVWLFTGVYFAVAMGDNTYAFYVPAMLAEQFRGWSDFQIALLTAGPSLVALACMIAVGSHSDRTGERRWHVAVPASAAACGWFLATVTRSPWAFLLAITLTTVGMKCMLGTFWTLPTSMLKGTAAAGGIALINSVANLGGFVGSKAMGKAATASVSGGDYSAGMWLIAGVLGAAAVLVLFSPRAPA